MNFVQKLNKVHVYWIILLSFLINLIIKLTNIDLAAFTYDEIISVKDTFLDFGHIKHESEWDANPPFYYYCLWVWSKLFGISEFVIRSFSALMNSLALAFSVYFINKHYSKTASILFSIMFILHPALFFYAQEARCYSLVLFLSSICLLIFYKFIQNPNYLNAFFLGLINFLLFYTHYITFFIPLIQLIIISVKHKSAIKQFIFSGLFSLALVYLRFTPKQYKVIFGIGTDKAGDKWIEYANFNDLINFINQMYFNWIIYLVIILIGVYILKFKTLKNNVFSIQLFIVLISILTPIIFFVIGTKIPLFIGRYILYSTLFSLIALSIAYSYEKKIVLVITTLIVFSIIHFKWIETKGANFREIAYYVKAHQNNRPVILNTKDITGLFTYYYNIDIFKRLKDDGKTQLRLYKIFDANSIEDFNALPVLNEKEIILIQMFSNDQKKNEIYDLFRSKGFRVNETNAYQGLNFVLISKN